MHIYDNFRLFLTRHLIEHDKINSQFKLSTILWRKKKADALTKEHSQVSVLDFEKLGIIGMLLLRGSNNVLELYTPEP